MSITAVIKFSDYFQMEKLDIFQDEVTLRTFVQKQFWHDIMWFCSDT